MRLSLFALLTIAAPLAAQSNRSAERTRWEYGQYESAKSLDDNSELARWTVGDSVILSRKSTDDLLELVSRRRNPKVGTPNTFVTWLGDQGWEMVSCIQSEPLDQRRTFTMMCWFKRPKP